MYVLQILIPSCYHILQSFYLLKGTSCRARGKLHYPRGGTVTLSSVSSSLIYISCVNSFSEVCTLFQLINVYKFTIPLICGIHTYLPPTKRPLHLLLEANQALHHARLKSCKQTTQIRGITMHATCSCLHVSVYPQHARLEVRGGRAFCTALVGDEDDLTSKSYTWMNGVELRTGVQYMVGPGASLSFGECPRETSISENLKVPCRLSTP